MIMLLPLGTVTPLNALIKLLLVTNMYICFQTHDSDLLKRSKRKTIAKIKSVICYLLVLGAAAGGNNAVLVLVANSKTEESQR